MTTPTPRAAEGTTTLVFQAPPPLPEVPEDIDEAAPAPALPARREQAGGGGRRTAGPDGRGGLRMLKGAREAATRMRITDEQIRAVLDDPEDMQPDPTQPQRTRFSRDGLVVTTGNDGMILRVVRRR